MVVKTKPHNIPYHASQDFDTIKLYLHVTMFSDPNVTLGTYSQYASNCQKSNGFLSPNDEFIIIFGQFIM